MGTVLKEGELVYLPANGRLQEGKVIRFEEHDGEMGYVVRILGGRAAREARAEEWYPGAALQPQVAPEERLGKGRGLGTRGAGKRQQMLVEMKVGLPDGLRWQLVNDWEQVCRRGVGIPLPRQPAVVDVLYAFREAFRDSEGYTHSELVNSLQEYFDAGLFGVLLYQGELELYRQCKCDLNKAPSAIFGAEHLLRLVVKLPQLLDSADVPEHKIGFIQSQLYDFVTFLSQNQATYFLAQYLPPDELAHEGA
mmetsp:Transcript_23636/g.65560  ORF Transcript_23636/g.65560 Transcript_23636/m.65560 type:complete len:251 (+) Transcript_23636:183-935(+)